MSGLPVECGCHATVSRTPAGAVVCDVCGTEILDPLRPITPASSRPPTRGGAGQTPASSRPPVRDGVGPAPAPDSTPGAGRATTAEVEGASRRASRPGAIPRWSWALVDGLGRFVRERWDLAVIVFFAVAVPAFLGLAMWLAAERRGVAW